MALRIREASYAELHELLDAARCGLNGEAERRAIRQQPKRISGAAAEESARTNGDNPGEEEEEEEEEEEGDEEEDGDEHLGSPTELRVLIAEVVEDESHFITTHEIQLSELDHDVDCDVSACASWDGEDEHQVYTFVDYASFEREDTIVEEAEEEAEEDEEEEQEERKSGEAKSAQPEVKRQSGDAAGRVHVAIRARAVNEPGGERASKEETVARLIAVPGRLHIGGGRLRGRDAHEHSSGASSAVSDLDDADKEVRNLTARSFRSLAYPYAYPCALSFSTSSESSASDRGRSRWSALVDLKYGKKARAAEQEGDPQARGGVRAPPVELLALNGSAAARGDKLEIVLRRAPDGMEGPHRRAALASNLLKSVLGKKVQFERERRMERGEIRETESAARQKDVSLVCLDELSDVAESPKKGARGGALRRSQNSAFRSWRDGELGLHEERQTGTKMSRLFVPSIQGSDRGRSSARGGGGPSKLPEIKISLRSARGDPSEPPLTVADALAAALRSEPSERVPHFTVRDVRDTSKAKLQAPIHQVRDVRKLVKSSYHFVSLEGNEGKGGDGERKTSKQSWTKGNSATLSPMVIKCQSVNTSSGVKKSGNTEPPKQSLAEDAPEPDGSPTQGVTEGIKTEVHNTAAQVTPASVKLEGSTGLRIETSSMKRQDKVSSVGEKAADPKMAALEKLQAAVKTMEQLYVFDKHEWKRKAEPQPITNSHVLPLIAKDDLGETEEEQRNTDSAAMRQGGDVRNPPVGIPGKSISSIGLKKSAPTMGSSAPHVHQSSSASFTTKAVSTKSSKMPVPLKITKPKPVAEERERPNGKEAGFTPVQFTSSADSESYLTIPVKPAAKQPAASSTEKAVVYTFPAPGSKTQTVSPPSHLARSSDAKQHEGHQSPKRSSIVMETRATNTPTATIYHQPRPITMQAATPQLICFSPTMQPSPVPTEHFQHMQRKMLLDPTTGNYYLVDTPVQPATRRLFDPETGQYVDVPMPQQPPMTPVPMPMSPLALSPGAYAHTYMFYPGYMPTTVIPARIQSQLSVQSDIETGDKGHAGEQGDGAYMEGPCYMSSGKPLQTASGVQPTTANRAASSKQPVISITSQQGPRIIAPPSFDGTTMSFVVEHR